uniref:Molybdopterin dehydrogenase, FAD-binding n=1 Tax=Solibacter usitatus (strain Ellin6076) TaxID=234267 RepID=Q020N2_SOLUE
MKPFTYTRAKAVPEAIAAIAEPHSKFLGGGTNLIDLMKMGVEQPDRLVDITRVPMASVEEHEGGIRIGAMARNSDVAEHPLIRQRYPVLSQALLAGASPQLRNMATMGGNLMQRTRCYYFYDPSYQECNKRRPGSGCAALHSYNRIHAILGASPHCIAVHPSDLCVALAALDATVQVSGPRGERGIPMADFHRPPGTTPQLDTNLHSDELITAIDLPATPFARRSHYLKVRDRNSYAFALVSVAAVLDVDSSGLIRSARIALGGVAHKPWRRTSAEKLLAGQKAQDAAFRAAADELVRGAQPYRDNRFKVELARRAVVRALQTTAALT